MRLVQADVEAGFADWIPSGVEEARRIFGANCAAGKLCLVKKAGSEPRLVGGQQHQLRQSAVSHPGEKLSSQVCLILSSLCRGTPETSGLHSLLT